MARVLLIDDDQNLLDVLTLAFEDAGHEVVTAADGQSGHGKIAEGGPEAGAFDAVVSDVNMPGMDGFTLCKKVREAGNQVPLVLLTSRDNDIDEALGLELGADDYVTKPFSTRVLLARIQALLRRQDRRAGKTEEPEEVVRIGKLELHTERLEVMFAGEAIKVTVTEFRLLEALTSRPGVVFSRDRLLDMVRGDDSVVAERLIDTYIRRLRRKLEAIDSTFEDIETVIGAGYRWRPQGS